MAAKPLCLSRDNCLTRDGNGSNPFEQPFKALNDWTGQLLAKLPLQQKSGNEEDASSKPKARTFLRRKTIANEPVVAEKSNKLDLSSLNPSLYAVGLDMVEQLLPRYLTKAGVACERMQHAGLPVEAIRLVLDALFRVSDGETIQSEDQLREVFALFDASGDGFLDSDEFFAVLPLMGEDVPPEAVGKLFSASDLDSSGTISGSEFVHFMRTANPTDADAADGWRAFLPEHAAHYEEMVLLQTAERKVKQSRGQAWTPVAPSDLEMVQRSAEAPYSTTLLLPRADLANAEALIAGLRGLGFKDHEVRTVAKALFVTNTDDDYAQVFAVFDRDHTGGIDPFEFRAIMALLGEHSTEGEARELFLEADSDNDGMLDVYEFIQLLRRISPKSTAAAEARVLRTGLARERLQNRIAQSAVANVDPAAADAMVPVLLLGASRSGKTFLLNQVLADKLPKGHTVAVGVGALAVRLGTSTVALQLLDTPGDARFAPLGEIFYASTSYALLMFDATSFDSFEALGPLFDTFVARHPGLDVAAHVCLVGNMARLGVKRAVSPGYALEWCRQRGNIPFFEVAAEAPQGILEPLHHIADEYLTSVQLAGERAQKAAAQADREDGGGGGGPSPQQQGGRRMSAKSKSKAAFTVNFELA